MAHSDMAGSSGYLPVSEHGLIGDMHRVALVGTNGTIDWYCSPSFDAPSAFGSLLDANRGGCFELAAAVPAKTRQFYHPDTNVLITRFFAGDGVGEIQDFMPVGGAAEARHRRLIRRVLCVRGAMPFRVKVSPRFGYGMDQHTLTEVSARFGTSRRSPAPGARTRRGWPSRRCSPTATTWACMPSRSAAPGSSRGTSPRH
jgi:GH15 family glucan-1,4-alpha-glucosidase